MTVRRLVTKKDFPMRSKKTCLELIVLFAIFTTTALVTATASDAPQVKILHSFSGSGKDGLIPTLA
jgi:hypothetical protein